MRALLSVSDKTGIVDFAQSLVELGFEIISTGGTFSTLKQNGVPVLQVFNVTNFNEIFDGRVKTLHPKIHGGILYKRGRHDQEAHQNDITPIDLICVNFYPFAQTIIKTQDLEEIIENIDIGGPCMVRAAAKNYESVSVVCDPNDYDLIIAKIKIHTMATTFRRDLAIKAFEHTAHYDATIANYFNDHFNKGFGKKRFIVGKKVFNTCYGENPHQKGALYEFDGFLTQNLKALKGEASFNNLIDISAAVKIAAAFGQNKTVTIVKHGNPCGVAIKPTLLQSYEAALKSDPVSAYGGVVAINGTLDEELAKKINEIFVEVILAAKVDEAALAVFEKKKRVKIFTQNSDLLQISSDAYDFKKIEGGFVYQDSDRVLEEEFDQMQCKTATQANKNLLNDGKMAYIIAALTKSNCVIYVKDQATLGIGMGMTSRVDAAKAAIAKAQDLGLDLKGCALASEAFFPFRDSVDEAARVGVKMIIQPGGSIRDEEVILASDEMKISHYFTGKRHFLH